ncbi:MAG: hypothetical protein RI957_1224 [Verrucomicrobiota bacterium]
MNDMKKYLLSATALLSSLFSSCYYDPFYYGATTTSYGVSSYGSGYSTSFFVSTGDPRWAYDPYRYCYYDRYRSCYYDPFLYGYYPVGYCPIPVRGCPHPYNWSGTGYCPPPRTIRNTTLSRYDNRISNYQAADYHWARKVSSAGSSSWMGSSERSRLSERASSTSFSSPSSSSSFSSSSWMNGGLRRSSGNDGFSPQSSAPRQGLSTGSSTGGLRESSASRTPTPTIRETPDIQPRPTSGGMFGGLKRSGDRSSSLRTPSVESTTPTPREESSIPAGSPERREQSMDSGSSPRGFSSGGESGGGLRRFQR